MKKIYFLTMVFLFFINSNSLALSINFENIINTMGIEKYNNQGYEINEYIYYTYNQIVYGNPELAANESTQRWKDVSDGKWIRNGKKGEYRLLGYNNIGKVVNNHDFPMDVIPSTLPTEWTYVELEDALESWDDIYRYKFSEQKNYMQQTNLTRNNITYDLNALDIGLNKTRLENCATWKTKGLIYTHRLDPYGKEWEATFEVKPIASNVTFKNTIKPNSDSRLTMFTTDQYVDVTVKYTAEVDNINEYINKNHIKKIESTIYVGEGKEKTVISTKTLKQSGTCKIRIYRSDFEKVSYQKQYNIPIQIRSKLYTEFTTDMPLYASNNGVISIWVIPSIKVTEHERERLDESEYEYPDFDIPNIDSDIDLNREDESVELGRIIKENNIKYIQDLNKTQTTESAESYGFVSAGQYLGVKVKPSNNTFKVEMSIDGDNITLNKEGNNYYYEYPVPIDIQQTLHSWNSIRDKYGSSFSIDTNMICTRIKEPYQIHFKIHKNETRETEDGIETYTVIQNKTIKYDVFEKWINLYNRDLSPYILNVNKGKTEYDTWIQS